MRKIVVEYDIMEFYIKDDAAKRIMIDKVNDRIKEGWEPLGKPHMSNGIYWAQAMTRSIYE